MVKAVIIDSGVNMSHPLLKNCSITGIHFYKNEEDEIVKDEDINDTFGHGTAVTSIIRKCASDAEIFMVRIFNEQYEVDDDVFAYALRYVLENVDCDIINLSLGITETELQDEYKDICSRFYDKGTILVSAFDNLGAVSFPAAFDTVIGVDSSQELKKVKEYAYVEESYVNVVAKGGMQRVAWKEPFYIFAKGNSFAAPYITGILIQAIEEEHITSKTALQYLKKNAVRCVEAKHLENEEDKTRLEFVPPKKALVFPFNKEIHSLVRFASDLAFEMKFSDVAVSGHVGVNTHTFVPESDNTIYDIKKIDWKEDFDTVILGHTDDMNMLVDTDYNDYILDQCIQYKKNIYSFSSLSPYKEKVSQLIQEGCHVYYPQMDLSDVQKNSFDKMYYISKPVVTVCGTSSVQGKFTVQMGLRKYLLEQGYRVGQIGTEPSALLYGMDDVCPMGYGSNVRITDYKFISAVNHQLYRVSQKESDIIITGTQSGTVPYSIDNLVNIPLYSIEYLLAVRPDVVILNVNPYDEIEYIQRTILSIENLVDTEVLGVVLFPMTYQENWFGMNGAKRKIADSEAETIAAKITEATGKEVYHLGSSDSMKELYDTIINYFGE